jgi:hypothetical protein
VQGGGEKMAVLLSPWQAADQFLILSFDYSAVWLGTFCASAEGFEIFKFSFSFQNLKSIVFAVSLIAWYLSMSSP